MPDLSQFDAMSHFDAGRQCVLQAVIGQIEIARDIDELEVFCREYLDRVLERVPA